MAATVYYCEWPTCIEPASRSTECSRWYCAKHYRCVMENRQQPSD